MFHTIMAYHSLLSLALFALLMIPPLVSPAPFSYPAVFNFGDSNSDTGGRVAGLGQELNLPNGETYFGKAAGRFCDGRLLIDFLVGVIDLPLLRPYLDSVGFPNFRKGANFAVAGSTITESSNTPGLASPFSLSVQVGFPNFRKGANFAVAGSTIADSSNTPGLASPFSLSVQVAQFIRFKARVLELKAKQVYINLPSSRSFSRGLYTIDVGQNDLTGGFFSQSEAEVIKSIPSILDLYETAIKSLYDEGARNFWIHNTGPLGCLPQNLARFGGNSSNLDGVGCISSHNRAARLFNQQLLARIKKWRTELAATYFTHTDVFTIKYDLITNYRRYGFDERLEACCGVGGPPYNYLEGVLCGQTRVINGTTYTAGACADPSTHVNWDGIHYTEAANIHVINEILTGKYSDPPFANKMPSLLNLKF